MKLIKNYWYVFKKLFGGFFIILKLPKVSSGIIFYSSDYTNSGAPKVFLNLLHSFYLKGINVISISREGGPLEEQVKKYSYKVITDYRHKLFFGMLKKKGYSVLFLNVISTFLNIEYFGKKQFKIFSFVHEHYASLKNKPFIDLIPALLKNSEYIFFPSKMELQCFKNTFRPQKEFSLIALPPNIFNSFQEINKEEAKKTVAKYIVIDDQNFYILSVSAHSPTSKGFNVFIDLANRMINEKIVFVWVGPVEECSFKPKNVVFIPNVGNKYDLNCLYSFADLYICLSDAETFGMVPLEAMMSGTLVASFTDNIGFCDYLINCFLPLKRNLEDICQTIEHVYSHQESYINFKENATNQIRNVFSYDYGEEVYKRYIK